MGNTEYFELCETSSGIQCPDCAPHWEAGIICCTSGKRSFQKGIDCWTRQDTTSCQSPAYLSRRIPPTQPDMDHLCSSACTTKHMICWGKPASSKVVVFKSILERWHDDDKYRKFLSDIGWIEEQIIQYDAIALEDHSYVATWQERSRNENSSKFFFECTRYSRAIESARWLHRSEAKKKKTVWRTSSNDWRWTQTYHSWATSQATTWSTIWRPRKIRLPTWRSYRMAILSFFQDDAFIFVITLATKQRLEVKSRLGFVANIILDWTINFSFLFRDVISLAGNLMYRAPHLLMHSCCTDVFLLVVRVYSHTLTPCTCMAQVTKHIVCVSPTNIHTSSSSRNVVHLAEPDTTHGHSFLTYSWISLPASRTTLRRSTATAEWRLDGSTALYSFKQKIGRSKKHFSDREDFSPEHEHVLGNNEPLYRFSNQEKSIISFFEEHRDFLLAEAKSEVRKHESRADYLDTSGRDLQRQLDSNRLGIYCTNQVYEETRKEQARLHEELAQREKALRDSRFRNIHEMEELKSAQEMRVDEFSIHKLKETHDTIQGLTSQIQELQKKRDELYKRFLDVPRCRVSLQWKIISRSPVSRQSFQVLDPCSAATKACNLIHGICRWHRETFFGNPRAMLDSSQIPYPGNLHSTNHDGTGGIPVQRSRGRPVANGEEQIGSTVPMPIFQEDHQPWILSLQRKYHRIQWLDSKDYRYRSISSINAPLHHQLCIGR